jgi:cytochrome c oxidase subunit 2
LIALVRHRKSAGPPVAHLFHDNLRLEILWTVIPVFILLGMAWPATKTILAMRDTSNADITIKATGYQWKWGYDYLKGDEASVSSARWLRRNRRSTTKRPRAN